MEKEPTTQDILDAILAFSGDVDQRLDGIEGKINTLPTKDYLDDKLGDLRGDLTILMRKEDTKVKKLVEILKNRKLITDEDVKEIMAMEPFPQLSL